MRKKKRTTYGMSTVPLHLMLLLPVLVTFVYSYLPMAGVVIAFQKYDITLGISSFWKSQWVGFDNFRRIFSDSDFTRALANTLTIAIGKMATLFVFPIFITLLLNEIMMDRVKKGIQTLIYMPHFLSWVILAGVIKDILGTDGLINYLFFQNSPIYFLGNAKMFQPLLIITNLWKEFGYSTIIYLAAITAVDPSLYEAAMVDGANRFKQTWHITLPGMMPIIVLSAVLSLRGILGAGFDQIYNLYSVPVYTKGDVIETLTFRKSISGGQYDIGTAIGLFNSTVGFILILVTRKMASKFANYEVF